MLFTACSKKDNSPLSPKVDTVSTSNVNPPTPSTVVFSSFSPQSGFIGDTLIITGKSFDTNPSSLQVKFGNVSAFIIKASETSATVIIPQGMGQKSKITVTSGKTELVSKTDFQLKAPIIQSISVLSGFDGQLIFVYGKGFSDIKDGQHIAFGKVNIPGPDINGVNPHTQFFFNVPHFTPADKYPITVTIDGVTATSPAPFEVLVPSITSITPESGKKGSTMMILGTNLKDPNGLYRTHVIFTSNGVSYSYTLPFTETADKLELYTRLPDRRCYL